MGKKVPARLEGLTDEEIVAKWRRMKPFAVKWMVFSGSVTAGVWLYNHFATPGQKITDVLGVVFAIGCIFTVMFGLLTGMAFMFGGKTPPGRN